mmetsp:Transcript_11307/g.24473  ORF Transcript_11307/g.24473 Transcript_11307/m.24473 type:complete len:154 (-) Transcript_11307:1125-1586(-)
MFSLLYGYVTGSEYGSGDESSPTQAERREANASYVYVRRASVPSSHTLLGDFSSSLHSPSYENGYYHDLSLESTAALSDVSNVSTGTCAPTVNVRTNDEGLKPLHNVESESLSAPASCVMPPSGSINAEGSPLTKVRNSSSCRRRHRTSSSLQ